MSTSLPNALSEGDEDEEEGPGKALACAAVVSADPASPSSDGGDLHKWLRQRLEQERRAAIRQLEERHRALLSDMERLSSKCSTQEPKRGSGASLSSSATPHTPSTCAPGEAFSGRFGSGPPMAPEVNHPLPHESSGTNGQLGPHNDGVASTNGLMSPPPAKGAYTAAALPERCRQGHGGSVSSVPSVSPTYQSEGGVSQVASRMSLTTDSDKPPNLLDNVKAVLYGEGTRYEKFVKIVKSQLFEAFVALLILLNAILISMQLQYQGLDHGYELGFRTYNRTARTAWPGAKDTFEAIEKVFVIIFTLEVIARVAALRCQWWKSGWSWIDALTVGAALVAWAFPNAMEYNPTIVRLARFGKLLRIVRVMRSNSILASLKLLVASIQASVTTLLWSICVVMLMQSLAGMFLVQMLDKFLEDPSIDVAARTEVFRYYGTFYRAMLTMFEVSFANWAPACRVLVDRVDESYGSFFVVYRCMIGFAVLSVVQAVFIQQTIKSAQLDDDFMVEQKNREKAAYVKKLQRMFMKLDQNKQGEISMEQFKSMLARNDLQVMMSTLEVEVDDLESLFKLLDDGDGYMNADEFVNGLQRLKGFAKSLDVLLLLNTVRRVEAKVDVSQSKLDGLMTGEMPVPPNYHKGRSQRYDEMAPLHEVPLMQEVPPKEPTSAG